jgi:general secretion pathway protein K
MNNMHRERGLALITAVFVVAIVATVAAFLALGQQIWLRQAQNFTDRAQGDAVARGATAYALMVLRDDAKKNAAKDDYGEIWAKPIATPVEGGIGAGQISDAQARFNLNNLVGANNQPDTVQTAVFRRLLDSLSLDPNLTDAVIDWIDPDNQPTGAGAEDDYYLTLDPPYRAANQKIVSTEELRLIKGFDAKTVETLLPFVTALPATTPININTADVTVLGALFNPAPGTLKQIVETRASQPFANVEELETRASANYATNAKAAASVISSYFLLETQTKFGRVNRGLRTLLKRDSNGVLVLWQRQLLPLPPKSEPPP